MIRLGRKMGIQFIFESVRISVFVSDNFKDPFKKYKYGNYTYMYKDYLMT